MSSLGSYSFLYEYFLGEGPKPQLRHYEFIDFKFTLKHQVWIQQQQTLILCHSYEGQLSMLTSCEEFFQNSITNLRRTTVQPALPDLLLNQMMQEVISYVRRFLENCGSYSRESLPASPYILPLNLDVVIDSMLNDNEEAMDMAISESMSEVRMIPASHEAIRSLKRVNPEISDETKQCSICLEEFKEGVEVLAMPCKHVYHNCCITQWLETSHMCPLCRFPMPV